jgi:hypothetical protein
MAEGRDALTAVRAYVTEAGAGFRNEAQTRLDIIDRLIRECFGWTANAAHRVRVEVHERGEFTDYEVGDPRAVIWEAKRESIGFELPPGTIRKPFQDLTSVRQRAESVDAAIRQVQGYCASRGVELAVVTNGHQLICFLATRNDGIAPIEGTCFAVESLEQLDAHFPSAWDLLSPDGLAERRYIRLLKPGPTASVPPKLSGFLQQYPRHRYLSELQSNLRTLSELLLQDIGETESEEATFYRRCYCSSGALSQHALLNRRILEARYAALTDAAQVNAQTESANPKDSAHGVITTNVLQEALSRRPVILIGDVGVGKTSFLKNLIFEGAKEVFQNAIYIYVNLGARGTLNPDIRKVILNDTERQLLQRYHIDVNEVTFLRGAYASEISRFRSGAYGSLFETSPVRAVELEADMLHGLTQEKSEHLRRSVEHLAKGRHHQVVFILDNADQRNDQVQQEAFLIAQELARDWSCHVFVALRPSTFYRSRTSGVLAAYPHRVFTISPPRVDEFLEKRLTYALDMAEGRLPVERLRGITLNLSSIACLLKALLQSLRGDELQELLANVTGGNVRELLQFLTSFIGSPNVNSDKIVSLVSRGSYRIPLHEFSKAALLGDYAHYQSDSSLAMNVFDIRRSDSREHFLVLLILAFLHFRTADGSDGGFIRKDELLSEMMALGFTAEQVFDAVGRSMEKRLVETPHRVILDNLTPEMFDDSEDLFRLTARGAYHLQRWVPTFGYLDAMTFDTPVVNEAVREELSRTLESFEIEDRLRRTILFRDYLSTQWAAAGIRATYFDFREILQRGESTFSSVQRATQGAGRGGSRRRRG